MPTKTASKSSATTPRPKKQTQAKLSFGPPSAKKVDSLTASKKAPANGNILNFFKKVEIEEQLFCGAPTATADPAFSIVIKEAAGKEDLYDIESAPPKTSPRYNEDPGASKRRKVSHSHGFDGSDSPVKQERFDLSVALNSKEEVPTGAVPKPKRKGKAPRGKGPFLDDSDSEDDNASDEQEQEQEENKPKAMDLDHSETASTSMVPLPRTLGLDIKDLIPSAEEIEASGCTPAPPDPPELKQEDSTYDHFSNVDEIEGMFDNDIYEDGDEFRERIFMEEQARLEDEEALMANVPPGDREAMTAACPLCNASLAGITATQATEHVNACLDGQPIPLPSRQPPASANISLDNSGLSSTMIDAPEVGKRFSKAAVPRPGQDNPISLDSAASKPTSAFGKLMSGHAEDAAWAAAAATENASRGKPAFQRTCPFYKIMPGFFICVDAFRYGAVKGCNAYFLSHFHSDHYIGLTSSWSHGPIYCSEVTASLIRNQLRTDAKWVKPIPFDKKIEVPGTEGVFITMISANHCPGSSLFLFEKSTGKGPNPQTQRILHCGDFRACPAQVTHPLLRPDLVDTVSGKIKQQKIDICYLDTTYLNPRYSFPPQDDVIKACADFCYSLSGDPATADEAFDSLRREKGSTSVSQFFKKEEKDSGGDIIKTEGSTTVSDPKNRLLVVCGTYSIGKERICKAIAKALGSKIYAIPSKIKICQQLGDPELSALLTSNPVEAQVHMQMLMELRAETLQEYLDGYKPHFTRIVGFRPSGWSFRGGGGGTSGAKNVTASVSPSTVPTTQILHGAGWKTRFSSSDFMAQRGSTREAMCFGVPYSEHSSFRELTLFVMSLRIDKVVPTVNVGSEPSRKRMKAWIDRWLSERRKGGVVRLLEGEDLTDENGMLSEGAGENRKDGSTAPDVQLWDGKNGKGGGVWW
ncbi:DNA cross-link repair 1A protein [Microdochium nivale]|nr:DNA cross-link repair 1A protein [Microdochium nivale]